MGHSGFLETRSKSTKHPRLIGKDHAEVFIGGWSKSDCISSDADGEIVPPLSCTSRRAYLLRHDQAVNPRTTWTQLVYWLSRYGPAYVLVDHN